MKFGKELATRFLKSEENLRELSYMMRKTSVRLMVYPKEQRGRGEQRVCI